MRTLLILMLTVPLAADDRVETLLRSMTLEEKVGQLSQFIPDQTAELQGEAGSVLNTGSLAQVEALQRGRKIPLLVGHDVIHGYRTIFPIPLAMAASFDPRLTEESARIAAREAKAAGIRWTFAPMVDIARDPRWGRMAEGSGEDPYLGARFAEACVRGFQREGVLATAKHFAAYGAAEGGRDYDSVEMSEATLREIYLPPFHAAARAGVASFMSAFNTLNGMPATANRGLLTEILRGDWKFDGFVVADFAAVAELKNHGIAATDAEAALLAMRAGVDMDMWDGAYRTLARSVREGKIAESVIDEAVRRVLRAKVAAGLFDAAAAPPVPQPSRAAARRIAQRSIVLLKNDGTLPLAKTTRVALLGELARSKADMLGPWAAEGKPEETVSVAEAIRGVPLDEAEVIVAVVGESRELSGEAASRASLDVNEPHLLEEALATKKPVILVLMSGRPLIIQPERFAAVVQAWFLGSEGGHALADILYGDVSPSAKLPVSWPRAVGQIPVHYNHLPTGRPAHPDNKFTSRYRDVPIPPLYPFGHGLTYTTFAYANLTTRVGTDAITISADIRNSGKRAGEEIVQLYVRDLVASVSRPVRELKGFERVALQPGETKRVTFTLSREQLAFWLDGRWRVEPGEFRVWVAPDALGGIEGTFTLP